MTDANSKLYLLGCLLTYYQQLRIWIDRRAQWTDFNLTKPLWVFLGKTVIGSSTDARETRSDIVQILIFFSWVLSEDDAVRTSVNHLIDGQSGLLNDEGTDFFSNRYHYLRDNPVEDVYLDICNTLFHGPGQLRVDYLTDGAGELHLHSANNEAFGVVNVGDSTALFKVLNDKDYSNIAPKSRVGIQRTFISDC